MPGHDAQIIMIGMHNSLLVLHPSSSTKVYEHLKGTQPQSVIFDPNNPSYAYCGTFGNGLWKTEDEGQTWNAIGKDAIHSPDIMSVAISHDHGNRNNKIYVGTEPSALYISNDNGHSWEEMNALNNLPSSTSWSFPPRPWTHHIRWIEPDLNNIDNVFVAIEAGALVKSTDGGRTWIDRTKHGPYDTHTLSTHLKAPGRLYSSAGDGYFESTNYGETWKEFTSGLRHQYLYGLAVDSGDPNTVIVSASFGPSSAYVVEDAESHIYRKSLDEKDWKPISDGLPESSRTTIATLIANPKIAGEFYAVNNHGVFISVDSGLSWNKLEIQWSKEYYSQSPRGFAIAYN
ncbi:MAG TPA: hypothetical protein VH500_25015 [Nitrososphaeraceae archaeon]